MRPWLDLGQPLTQSAKYSTPSGPKVTSVGNTPPMKAFRAPGFVEGTFGLECLIDELAAKLGLDPLAPGIALAVDGGGVTGELQGDEAKRLDSVGRVVEDHAVADIVGVGVRTPPDLHAHLQELRGTRGAEVWLGVLR
ncbi:hypothetical protein B4Q13_20255, partial [Lacticaseibacillus rhamnosus]